ncbi:MAG TPA: hypothetical protein VK858_06500 [Longimicrobiales bacterium]|nr:hypothetical protein [Longimicrobiales bacterium]
MGLEGEFTARTPAVEGLQEAGPVDLAALRVPAVQGLWVVVETR